MCGRYTHKFTWQRLRQLMALINWPEAELPPRFNIAPTQIAPVVRLNETAERSGVLVRWGLIPSWSDGPASGPPLFNARGETVATKLAFRSAFKSRRCLVPISGFYEWKKVGSSTKQPYWIGRADREPFALAGLWERSDKGPDPVESFTIITTEPNDLLAPLHDRMPVILRAADYGTWLDPAADPQSLIRPAPVEEFEKYPVSSRVNSVRNDDPSLIERFDPGPQTLF